MIQKKKCNKTRDKSKRQWEETERAKKEKKEWFSHLFSYSWD